MSRYKPKLSFERWILFEESLMEIVNALPVQVPFVRTVETEESEPDDADLTENSTE
jgi:hypothetical protein